MQSLKCHIILDQRIDALAYVEKKRSIMPVNYSETRRKLRDREIEIKLERMNTMQRSIVLLSQNIFEKLPPIDLTEDEICETIAILASVDDDVGENVTVVAADENANDESLASNDTNEIESVATVDNRRDTLIQNDVESNNIVAEITTTTDTDTDNVSESNARDPNQENRSPNESDVSNASSSCASTTLNGFNDKIDSNGQSSVVDSAINSDKSSKVIYTVRPNRSLDSRGAQKRTHVSSVSSRGDTNPKKTKSNTETSNAVDETKIDESTVSGENGSRSPTESESINSDRHLVVENIENGRATEPVKSVSTSVTNEEHDRINSTQNLPSENRNSMVASNVGHIKASARAPENVTLDTIEKCNGKEKRNSKKRQMVTHEENIEPNGSSAQKKQFRDQNEHDTDFNFSLNHEFVLTVSWKPNDVY